MKKVVRGGGRPQAGREDIGMTCNGNSENLCGNFLFAFGIAKLPDHDGGQISPGAVSGRIYEIWIAFKLLDVVKRLQSGETAIRESNTQSSPAYASSTGIG